MQSKPHKKNTKQTYQKPRLRTIELNADEVLAIGCKTDAPLSGPVAPTCTATPCVDFGS